MFYQIYLPELLLKFFCSQKLTKLGHFEFHNNHNKPRVQQIYSTEDKKKDF